MALNGSFEGSVRDRFRRGVVKQLASTRAHRDQRSLNSLISQCQAALRQNPIVRAVAGGMQAMIVGEGPRLKATSPDQDWNNMVEARYNDWAATRADVAGLMSLEQIYAATPVQWLTDGGTLIHRIEATEERAAQIQCIEIARLQSPSGVDRDKTFAGITTDERGRPQTYHIADFNEYGTIDYSSIREVAAENMLYCPPPRSLVPGQVRAEPMLASVLEHAEFVHDSARAVHTAFVMAAELSLLIKLEDPSLSVRDMVAAGQVAAGEANNTTDAIDAGEWTRGQVLPLGLGESVDQVKTEHPTTQYTDFYREQIRDLCAALGIPMSIAFFLFDKSYSASRAELAVMQRHLNQQRAAIQNRLSQPIYLLWLAGEIRMGRIEPVTGWRMHAWSWPATPVLDPKIEVEARARQLAANLTTRERALRDLGIETEVEEFYKQRESELEIEQQLGIETAQPSTVTVSETAGEPNG